MEDRHPPPNPEEMTDLKRNDLCRIGIYLGVVAVLWGMTTYTLQLLRPAYAAYEAGGPMTAGYLVYSAIGLLFTTPAPFWAALLVALWEKRPLRGFLKGIVRCDGWGRTLLLTALFCAVALGYTLLAGEPNGEPWYLLPGGFLVMIPFVGIAEEAGWRGVLQPTLEEPFSLPVATLITALIWWVWHADMWFDPTSHHYGDSFLGFGVCILVWAFSLAVLYRATRSVLACAVYHAFMDAIGAVYDWNALFDGFPGNMATNVYRLVVIGLSAVIWRTCCASKAEKKEKLSV